MTGDYVIDTSDLTGQIQTVQQAMLPGQDISIYHGEAGITIRQLYNSAADRDRLAGQSDGNP